ncbi:MAG: hypothetical protein HS116_23190 [Planctomycetes bacterium]|nr:hypothetical protein [Planctomycetota bacterium]
MGIPGLIPDPIRPEPPPGREPRLPEDSGDEEHTRPYSMMRVDPNEEIPNRDLEPLALFYVGLALTASLLAARAFLVEYVPPEAVFYILAIAGVVSIWSAVRFLMVRSASFVAVNLWAFVGSLLLGFFYAVLLALIVVGTVFSPKA